jgi:hypothetical protein
MTNGVNEARTSQVEFNLDRDVEELIGRLVSGQMTPAERARYDDMVARRSRLMRANYRERNLVTMR